jgi:hypothetical protein
MKTAAMALAAVLVLPNCATLLKSGYQEMMLDSEPRDARIYMNGSQIGRTPLNARLPTGRPLVLEFQREGFEKRSIVLNNSVGVGWVILDCFLIFPLAIDAATGDWYYLNGEGVMVMFQPPQPP